MSAHIICVGKLKSYYTDACGEYLKRITRWGGVGIVQIQDMSEPANASPADIERIKNIEGERILKEVSRMDRVFCLDSRGKQSSSLAFAEFYAENAGKGRLAFVIGGSNGLSESVLSRADGLISLSDMTLPHQLARLVLLEQIYRAHTILAGQKYHK